MRIRTFVPGLVVVGTVLIVAQVKAVTVQTAANVFDGRPYMWVEGESVNAIAGTPGSTWQVVAKGGPEMSTVSAGTSVPILPATSNVSGGALWAPANDFSSHTTTATYQVRFITPGTYQFYLRQSLYDSNNNGNFLNEDSIYLPPTFNKNSGTDWIGFEGLEFDENDINVDIPNPGYALDPNGWKPSTGDHDRDGLLELANWGIKSDGVVTFHTPAGTLSSNGNFNWYNRPAYQGTKPPGNTFDGFFGMKNEFIVTPEMVDQTLNFEVGMREVNVTIDGFLFIQTDNIYPDMDLLDLYSQEDLDAALLPQPVNGDYNGNGSVDAADYVLWRGGGPLQNDPTPGVQPEDYDVWRAAFGQPGGSGLGSGGAVPEPASIGLVFLALAAFSLAWNRRGN